MSRNIGTAQVHQCDRLWGESLFLASQRKVQNIINCYLNLVHEKD